MSNLKKRVALVTGAGSGIGQAAAELFGRKGVTVIVSDIDSNAGANVSQRINSFGGTASFVLMDVSDSLQVKEAISSVAAEFGGPDILVNNAGVAIGMGSGPVPEVLEEIWNKTIDVNLKGAFLCSKYTIPYMIKRGGGSIINVASTLGLYAVPGASSYCASKGGLISLSRAMAIECAPSNIRVNCVCPGAVLTPPMEKWFNSQKDSHKIRRLYNQGYPIKRIGSPEEIAKVIYFLASEESSFVAGSTVVVDGGLHSAYGETILRMILDGVIG
jgi:NAD(P)-dependent dehydrogenase (short-subunit alcohol dehydrogenase family)